MKRFVPRLTYANAMATIAVFIALGGVSYAAFKLPKNSVGTKQLKKNAVTSAKVKDRSLLAKDFKSGQLPQGPKGDAGPQGPKGDAGPQGPGATTLNYDETASATPTPTTVGTVLGDTFSAECFIPGPDEALLTVYLQTSDGSLRWDYGSEQSDNGTSISLASSTNQPAGTITAPTKIAEVLSEPASQSDHNSEVVQLSPQRGYLNVHATAKAGAPPGKCHLSVLAFPSG